jgi:hypothetical protein
MRLSDASAITYQTAGRRKSEIGVQPAMSMMVPFRAGGGG